MFYEFDQNNSGGRWVSDPMRGIGPKVIIEAASAEEANAKAEDIGLYFDGEGDCPCCGDRWCEQWYDDKGTDEPMVYDRVVRPGTVYAEELAALKSSTLPVKAGSHAPWLPTKWMRPGTPEGYIHYADGMISGFWS